LVCGILKSKFTISIPLENSSEKDILKSVCSHLFDMSAGCVKEWPRAVCVNVHMEYGRWLTAHSSGDSAWKWSWGPSWMAVGVTWPTGGVEWHHNANDICLKEWQRESGYR